MSAPSSPLNAEQFALPPGICFITTYGALRVETCRALAAVQMQCLRQGLHNIGWEYISGNLVEKTRNEAVQMLLAQPAAQWLLFIDADMVFDFNTLLGVLQTAYKDCLWADVVGAWCPLRGEPYLPTIDTGTGTWEPHEPGNGPLEVIRTGAAFVLAKRHVYERLAAPWYAVRHTPRALETLAEIDNFARIKFDGRNPFQQHPAWDLLLRSAREEAAQSKGAGYVGEDSGFCDKAKAAGFRIVVQTNAVCGHVDTRVIGPNEHRAAIQKRREQMRLAVGVLP